MVLLYYTVSQAYSSGFLSSFTSCFDGNGRILSYVDRSSNASFGENGSMLSSDTLPGLFLRATKDNKTDRQEVIAS